LHNLENTLSSKYSIDLKTFLHKGHGRNSILPQALRSTSSRYCLQTQSTNADKAPLSKEKAICEHEIKSENKAKAHLKWTEAKWKTGKSNKLEFELFFGNHERSVLWTKEEKRRPVCYQLSVVPTLVKLGL